MIAVKILARSADRKMALLGQKPYSGRWVVLPMRSLPLLMSWALATGAGCAAASHPPATPPPAPQSPCVCDDDQGLRERVSALQAEVEQLRSCIDLSQGAEGAREISRPERVPPPRPAPGQRYDLDLTGAPVLGNPNAPLSIVLFTEPEYRYSARVFAILRRVQAHYGDSLRVVFKHLPMPFHPRSRPAARALWCAQAQGLFWPMYERVIQQPRRLGEVALLAHATYVGLDVDAWQRCLRAKDADRVIDADAAQAAAIGLRRAPSFLLNGRHVAGVQPDGVWRRLIDTELGRAHSEEAPAPPDASGADEVNPPPDEPVRQHPDDFENVESVTD